MEHPVSEVNSGGRILIFKSYLKKNSTDFCRSRRWEGSRFKIPCRMSFSMKWRFY